MNFIRARNERIERYEFPSGATPPELFRVRSGPGPVVAPILPGHNRVVQAEVAGRR